MTIYRCGTQVTIKLSNTDAVITCAQISFSSVRYELTFCLAGEFKTLWCYEEKFTSDSEKTTIGFR